MDFEMAVLMCFINK